MYDIPPEPSFQTIFFKNMEKAKKLWKKFTPIYAEYLKEIDDMLVEILLKLDKMSGEDSLKNLDVVAVVMILDALLREIYRNIAEGKPYVILRVLKGLGFKTTVEGDGK